MNVLFFVLALWDISHIIILHNPPHIHAIYGDYIGMFSLADGEMFEVDIKAILAESLMNARETVNMTQKELSEATGIHQADISKIERGLANPSLSTLKRLAKGMGMELHFTFTPLRKEG